jgi:hypothetical protein
MSSCRRRWITDSSSWFRSALTRVVEESVSLDRWTLSEYDPCCIEPYGGFWGAVVSILASYSGTVGSDPYSDNETGVHTAMSPVVDFEAQWLAFSHLTLGTVGSDPYCDNEIGVHTAMSPVVDFEAQWLAFSHLTLGTVGSDPYSGNVQDRGPYCIEPYVEFWGAVVIILVSYSRDCGFRFRLEYGTD